MKGESALPAASLEPQMARPSLRISYDADLDHMWATVHGAALDGQLDDEVDEPLEGLAIMHAGPGGPVIGFHVEDAFAWDPNANADCGAVWGEENRFDVPTLALADAPIGLIVLAAQQTITSSTPDSIAFDKAVSLKGQPEEAEGWWRLCLAAGDLKAHFGLGYTLLELDRPRDAYGHLAAYAGLQPRNSWAWHWRAQGAEAIGEIEEAKACYRRAIEAEEEGSFETDADERMAALD